MLLLNQLSLSYNFLTQLAVTLNQLTYPSIKATFCFFSDINDSLLIYSSPLQITTCEFYNRSLFHMSQACDIIKHHLKKETMGCKKVHIEVLVVVSLICSLLQSNFLIHIYIYIYIPKQNLSQKKVMIIFTLVASSAFINWVVSLFIIVKRTQSAPVHISWDAALFSVSVKYLVDWEGTVGIPLAIR